MLLRGPTRRRGAYTVAAALLSLLPSFSAFVLEGSRTSYAQFRAWSGSQDSGLTFQFRTEWPDGLLLYTDDQSTCDSLELKLVAGRLRLRLNTGAGPGVLQTSTALAPLSDDRWHSVEVTKRGENTTLLVDSDRQQLSCAATADPGSLVLGNMSNNHYVYVGGLPSWYSAKLKALAIPSVAFEPRFRGSFRSLVYTEGGRQERQEMLAYKGVRASTVDPCKHQSPCLNGGKCLSTDQGPVCECDGLNYKGVYCEEESPSTEAVFRGGDGVRFDLHRLGGEAILASSDTISLHFRTRKSTGLLYFNGDGPDYLLLHLQDGGVSLTISQRSGKLDTAVRPPGQPFNDNLWHQVTLTRRTSKQEDGQTACQVTMKVDGKYTERWKTVGRFNLLASSTVILAGTEGGEREASHLRKINNLVGCLKKVVYTADSLSLPLLSLAKAASPLMVTLGNPEWACQDIGTSHPLPYRSGAPNTYQPNLGYYLMQQGGVISFTDPESFLVLPTWKSSSPGSLSLRVRTTERSGLLLYNSGQGEYSKDYFGLELLDGFIYVHINLGRHPVKFQANSNGRHLSDGEWHKIELSLTTNNGQITIDGDMETFKTQDYSDELELGGSFYVGGVDYMDPNLILPPAMWTASLKQGFVGCLKDLVINGADIDLVAYTHEQNSGSIRTSCHVMPATCHDRPCLHGGQCREGWNRYICDCSQTSFFGATCSRGTATVSLDGGNYMSIDRRQEAETEAQDITLRFRTTAINGLLFVARSEATMDRLEMSLDGGRVKIFLQLGHYDKTLIIGQSLNDDLWHTVTYSRRGNKLHAAVDDEEPRRAEANGAEPVMSARFYHIGGMGQAASSGTSTTENFSGRLQQVVINGERILDEAHLKQLHYEGSVKFQHMEDSVYQPVSFSSHHTYLGMPQLRAYNIIDIYFQFKTTEADGLLMYNGGKDTDFIAVELIQGHLHYTYNMGYGPVTLKDNSHTSLADNKYHSVWIRRPSRRVQVIIVDNYHKVASEATGDNYHLNLDGILYLGGVKSSMYKELPSPLVAQFGFQGCLASLELNGVVVDPNKEALVTSPAVSEGCQESVAYEFRGKGGVITYNYPDEKKPDTKGDSLSLAFISGQTEAVLVRVDSQASSDYLSLKLVGGHVFVSYNLGTQDITVGDTSQKFNDGNYHVVRFTRNGPNSTLQIDDNASIVSRPDGRHLTVFNTQDLLQVGGRWNEGKHTLENPFQGVLAGIVYNGLRPLDMAHDKEERTKIRGSVTTLNSIPYDYKEQNPGLFQDSGVQGTAELYTPEGSGAGGGGREDGGSRQLTGIRFKEGGFMPCDDDEDLCDFGSGGGEGGGGGQSVFIPSQSDNQSKAKTTSVPTIGPPFHASETTTEMLDYSMPTLPPTHWQSIDLDTQTEHEVVKGYDEKYNMAEEDQFETKDKEQEEERQKMDSERGMSPTMSLVIGIIIGSFTAMILIVIIVLKVRTGVDIAEFKQEEMQRYQFSSPSVAEREEFGHSDTASTSLIDGGVGKPPHQNNGFFNGGLSTALNGDRARLFKKANSYGRPVREWYV